MHFIPDVVLWTWVHGSGNFGNMSSGGCGIAVSDGGLMRGNL